jgi:hypothetical protein
MNRRNVTFIALAVLFLAYPLYTAPDKPPQEVTVSNFPDLQNVGGTVSVSNLPTIQRITGQVLVANLPVDQRGRVMVSGGATPFRFVGVTTARFDGAAGWAAMTSACYQQYGGRMAFADEYRVTVGPGPIPEPAWIQPRVELYVGGSGSIYHVFDSAGNGLTHNVGASPPFRAWNCQSWTSSVAEGPVIDTTGRIVELQACSETRPVACVAP